MVFTEPPEVGKGARFLTHPLTSSPLLFPVQTNVVGLTSPWNGRKMELPSAILSASWVRIRQDLLENKKDMGHFHFFSGILKKKKKCQNNHKNCDFFKKKLSFNKLV